MKPFADKHHHLEFSYDQYLKNNSSISNCLIGHYLVCEELARGNYGTVYKGIDERTNKDVAIKLLNMYHVECERN